MQEPLFHEDFRDALRHMVKALGGYDVVGADLWPAKSRKQAGAWLSDCLNPERPAKLDLEEMVELVRMGRRAGVHCAMHQLADDTDYERPAISPGRTAAQLIAERMQRLTHEFTRLADEAAAVGREPHE